MSRAADVVELVLDEIRAGDSRAFAPARYRAELILYTGAQLPGRVPARIREMRALAGGPGTYSHMAGGARLFYEQARFMAGFEDDCPYSGEFSRYYPTYSDMPDRVLRGYFTWRARYAAGKPEACPLSFLFVHAYELLCGIGAAPGLEGYRALDRLRQTYAGSAHAFDVNMETWLHDYAIYHGLAVELAHAEASEFGQAVSTLRSAEQALLALPAKRREAYGEGGTWATGPACDGLPDMDALFGALSTASRYHVGRSAALRGHRRELVEACVVAFARMVAHCGRRRKTGFVDGMFGEPTAHAYRMFASAVFHEPVKHADADYRMGAGEAFVCRHGAWYHQLPYRREETGEELGVLLHAVDRALRERIDDLPALKPRKAPAFVAAIATAAVETVLARIAAEEAARVVIDRSALGHIRLAAAATCEALLVDEERDLPASDVLSPAAEGAREPASQPPVSWVVDELPLPWDEPEATVSQLAPTPSAPVVTVHDPTCADAPTVLQGGADAPYGLSELQLHLVRALLDGCYDAPTFPWAGAMPALEVDAVNEKLMDVVGDVVVEFDGDEPCLVEDYREELREALG